jgi:hypothetical protein
MQFFTVHDGRAGKIWLFVSSKRKPLKSADQSTVVLANVTPSTFSVWRMTSKLHTFDVWIISLWCPRAYTGSEHSRLTYPYYMTVPVLARLLCRQNSKRPFRQNTCNCWKISSQPALTSWRGYVTGRFPLVALISSMHSLYFIYVT